MASAEITSNLKLITSGTIPTTSNLANGELAFGLVGGVAKLYGNVNGTIMDFSSGGALSEEQVDLYDYDWQDMGGTYEATKYISEIDYDSMIWYSATTESLDDFADAGIVMIRQGYGEVTFCCKEVPQNQIGVLVRWQ